MQDNKIPMVRKVISMSIASMICLPSAFAQSVKPDQNQTESWVLEELVVTAQKRLEIAQEVPISISVFRGDELSSLGITETDQLGQYVPGLEISTSSGEGSQLIIFLRGAGLNDFNTNNAGPIAVYSDEVYVSSPALTPFQFFDVDRVEILKGPQGTLYGRNTTGGAVKFITKKPTDELDLNVKAVYGNFGTSNLEAAISGPLSKKVSARAAIVKSDSDGYAINTVDGSSTNGVDTLAWRTTFDFHVNEKFTVRANAHGAQIDSPSTKFNLLGVLPGNQDFIGNVGSSDPFRNESDETGNVDLSSTGGYLEAEWDLGGFQLTSVTAYDEVDRSLPEETDASAFQAFSIDYGVSSETFTQEIRASGGNANSFEWLVGGFYLDEDLNQNQTIDLFRGLRILTGGLADPTGESTGGLPILFARGVNDQATETFALFGQVDFAVNDKLTLTVGGRYTDETKTFSARGQLEDAETFGPDPIVIYQASNLDNSDSAFSWRLAADYKSSENVLMYGSISRGFKSGGFNGGFLDLDPAAAQRQLLPYEPEFLTAYELGVKSDLLNNKLRLNASVFFNDFEDIQVFTLSNTGNVPVVTLDNGSNAEVFGLEFDAILNPADGVTFGLSAAFLDSELVEFVSAATGENFSGNEIANTPDTSISGLARYEFDVGALPGKLYIQGSFSYKSDLFFSTVNDPIVSQESYTLTNARLGYASSDGHWDIAVFGNNLGDEAYLTNVSDTSALGFYSLTYASPRTYGIEISADF